jgi:hypothetical protein
MMRSRAAIFVLLVSCAACSSEQRDEQPKEASATGAASAAGAAAAPTPSPTAAVAAVNLPAGASIEKAAPATVGMKVSGEIGANSANNFYRFDNPLKQRDLVLIRLENKSSTLMPNLNFYDANRSKVGYRYDSTPGATLEQLMPVDPGQTFYVEVTPVSPSAGAYELSAIPQKAYDSNEPNDNQLSPTPVAFGQSVEGGIMDKGDRDWFRFTGTTSAKINIVLENLSTTLKPWVKVYSATKSLTTDKYDSTPGAGLDFTAEVEAGKDFFIEVLPYDTSGRYKLSIKAAQ